jgi:hypothetical protein
VVLVVVVPLTLVPLVVVFEVVVPFTLVVLEDVVLVVFEARTLSLGNLGV